MMDTEKLMEIYSAAFLQQESRNKRSMTKASPYGMGMLAVYHYAYSVGYKDCDDRWRDVVENMA